MKISPELVFANGSCLPDYSWLWWLPYDHFPQFLFSDLPYWLLVSPCHLAESKPSFSLFICLSGHSEWTYVPVFPWLYNLVLSFISLLWCYDLPPLSLKYVSIKNILCSPYIYHGLSQKAAGSNKPLINLWHPQLVASKTSLLAVLCVYVCTGICVGTYVLERASMHAYGGHRLASSALLIIFHPL